MGKDTQSRKWQITINNPTDHGYGHEQLREILELFKSCRYWCMCDETGEEGTYHTHIYIHNDSAVRFSTVKKRFPHAHIEMCKGTAQENRDYIRKEGRYRNTEKETTNHKDTFEEWGEMPVERPGARNDLADLYDMIKSGMSTYEILEDTPKYMMQVDRIDKVRQTVLEAKYKDSWRDIKVEYIWGMTGTGKTRSVMDTYGYSNVYRITDYDHPFDSYKGQDVVVFEEFRSSLLIDDMLKYLDGYPVEFPARYNNKVACFTKVYIITNIDLRNQYPNIQRVNPMTWYAFIRRIHKVNVFTGEDVVMMDTDKYLKEYFPFFENTPFDKDGEANG